MSLPLPIPISSLTLPIQISYRFDGQTEFSAIFGENPDFQRFFKSSAKIEFSNSAKIQRFSEKIQRFSAKIQIFSDFQSLPIPYR
jgi:hypothetical protein